MSRNSGDDKKNWLSQSGGMTGLGNTIRALREGLQLTQEELAHALGVSRAAISSWETGQTMPRGRRLKRLADALSTTPAQLVSGTTKAGRPAAGAVIAVQSDGKEIPLVAIRSIEPALWAKTRQRVIVFEDKSGRRFGILATDETIQSLTDCLTALRELL